MIPFLFEAFEVILENLLKRFVKPNVIKDLSTAENLRISICEENFRESKDMDIGFATKSAIRLSASCIPEKEKTAFLKECRECLNGISVKLQKKPPLKYPIVEYSACSESLVMASDTNRKFSLLDRALNELIAGNWMSGFDAHQVKRQCESVTKNEKKVTLLRSYDESKDRLDTFLLQQCLQTGDTSSHSDHLVTFIRSVYAMVKHLRVQTKKENERW